MLRSMTGYGEAHAKGEGFELQVEVKSVNNRFLKVSVKLPEEIAYLQSEIEDVIRRQIERGSIFVTIWLSITSADYLNEIDEALLRKYLDKLRKIGKSLGLSGTAGEIALRDLLLLPGVVENDEHRLLGREQALPVAQKGLEAAVKKLVAMRDREGRNLERHFRSRSKYLRSVLEAIARLAPQAIQEYHARLEQRVNQLLANHELRVTPQDLIKEVAILAERSDITEEIDRMASHLEQLEGALDAKEPVGRKLEFLIQEMFREANTMASKSPSPQMNKFLVDMKAEVDRLKEQIQNVE